MHDHTIVTAPAGTVRGYTGPGGETIFAGIPFAAPPVGDRRFQPPAPAPRWDGIRDTVEFSPAPMQRTFSAIAGPNAGKGRSPIPPGMQGLALLAVTPHAVSEDCLYLNIWRPAEQTENIPVFVWFYGGGFDSGFASPPGVEGAALARQLGAIVVAPNYRVGALGYLHLADLGGPGWEGSTNLGVQDQAAAVRWVHDNIAAFGGDADNITIAGQSAGAYSAGTLVGLPAAAGTFAKAILQSGNDTRLIEPGLATSIAENLLAALNLDSVEGLMTVPAERILEVQNSVIDTDMGRRNLPGGRVWGAVLDGTVIRRAPHDVIAAGDSANVSLLLGSNSTELRTFQLVQGAAYTPADDQALVDEMRRGGIDDGAALIGAYRTRPGMEDADLGTIRSAFLTDVVYGLPASDLAATQVKAGGAAYQYQFAAPPFGPKLGAFHGAELFHVFDMLSAADIDTAEQRLIQTQIVTAWRDFVHTGNPGWAGHTPARRDHIRVFGADAEMVPYPAEDAVGDALVQQAVTTGRG